MENIYSTNTATDTHHIAKKNGVPAEARNIFPLEVFPVPIQKMIIAGLKSLDFPVDFMAASILSTLSISIGNTHKVQIKPGFLETPILYIAIVAPPGTNKTQAINFAMQPLINKDRHTFEGYRRAYDDYEANLKSSVKNDNLPAQQLRKPVWEKYLLSDFTLEALAEIHQKNERGLGVYPDELAGWFKNFNRYNKGSDQEFWLKSWSNAPYIYDRKGSKSIFIPSPFVSVIGTIQNGMLYELAKDNRNINGFIDRILFVKPDNLRKPYWSEEELDPRILKIWEAIVYKILNIPLMVDESHAIVSTVLKFDTEAKQALFQWQKQNTNLCNDAETEALSSVYGKFDVYVARLALILEVARWACGEGDKECVGIEATVGAIKLIEYFRKSASQINTIISGTDPLMKYPSLHQKVYLALSEYFKTGEGVSIASELGMPERTFKRFLNTRELFARIRKGEYEKMLDI